ncbi:MAG: LCP family protein [Lachnospiraceae bacterium]|nr:LCP family protein [Lachnospiraceae bacterium]
MNKYRRKSKKKLNTLLTVLIVIAVILLGIVGFAFWKLRDLHKQSNYTPDESVPYTIDHSEEASLESEYADIDFFPEIPEREKHKTKPVEPEPVKAKTYNLLLVGVDRRDRTWNGNSDSMILVTVNQDKQMIYLTSFQRDLYADIDGVGVRKLNHAYAVGGGPLLVQTIRKNYGVQIDNYASVDFFSMIEIIDMFGGVDIEITADEARILNAFMNGFAETYNIATVNNVSMAGGMTHMDGLAAMSYSRNRSIGNDSARTQRQRNVIQAAIRKARTMSISDLLKKIEEIVPHVLHNISNDQLIKLLQMVPSALKYDTQEVRVPFDGMYKSYNEIKTPYSMEETRAKIRGIIYGE